MTHHWTPRTLPDRLTALNRKRDQLMKNVHNSWVEGTVDQGQPYFVVIHGLLQQHPQRCVATALLGPMDDGSVENDFILQWLCEDAVMRQAVAQTVNYFLNRNISEMQQEMGRWEYLRYHATSSASNFYARVHFQYVDPPVSWERALGAWLARAHT